MEKPGGGGAAGKAARLGGGAKLICALCKTELSGTAPLKALTEHTDAKHSKLGAAAIATCFPGYVPS